MADTRRNGAVRKSLVTLLMLTAAAASTHRVTESSSNSLPKSDPQQNMGACRCEDLKDLFNRKAEIDRAIALLQLDVEIVLGAHLGEEKFVQAYDDAKDRHLLADDLQKAMDAMHDPAINNRVKNMTFPPDCESSVQGSTTCLHQAARAGEAVYMQYCESRKTVGGEIGSIVSGKGWQERTSLIQLLEVAQHSYEAELKFINDEMDRLKPLCKTKGWTGKVIVTYLDKFNGTRTSGGATPETTTIANEDLREVTIQVFDGKAYGEVSTKSTDSSATKASGNAQCGKYKNVPVVVDNSDTTEKHGDFYHRAVFSANILSSGLVTISVSINGGEAIGTVTHTDNGHGGCVPSPHPSWTKFLSKESLPGVTVTAHSKANPNALVLDGIDLPLDQQMILGSRSRVVKVEWHLTRSK